MRKGKSGKGHMTIVPFYFTAGKEKEIAYTIKDLLSYNAYRTSFYAF
ncbi:MAG: hypothetical protein JWO58_1834 [Chitinophagaceae bacterium]|nr:hypothetical protein [Chitinophagaceae bacterium]